MKIAFGSVVYESAIKYSDEFINSINSQTFKSFDLLIINDDVKQEEIQDICYHSNIDVVVQKGSIDASPPQLRVELIQLAKRLNYDLLILGDFDDCFSSDRISAIVQNYDDKYFFYYNQLKTFEGTVNFFEHLPNRVTTIYDIIDYNFLGLSNTAINLNQIDYKMLADVKNNLTQVFDWLFYSVVLLHGGKGKKIQSGFTRYRIHQNNIAGNKVISSKMYKKEVCIKKHHYCNLSNINLIFKSRCKYYSKLGAKNISINQLIDKPVVTTDYWWSLIRYDESEEKI